MNVFQVAIEFHRLEGLVPFWLDSPQVPSGPVVAPTPRGQQLGWIRQVEELADKPFPACRTATARPALPAPPLPVQPSPPRPAPLYIAVTQLHRVVGGLQQYRRA